MFEEMTETEKAYIAGIIDGEGSIILKHNRQLNRRGDGFYECYSLLVSVGNTDTELLEWLRSFGGKVYLGRKGDGGSRKPMYQWQLHTRKAAELLSVIYPYLIIKKKKAAAALFFQEMRGNTRHKDAESSRLDRELRALISPGRVID